MNTVAMQTSLFVTDSPFHPRKIVVSKAVFIDI